MGKAAQKNRQGDVDVTKVSQTLLKAVEDGDSTNAAHSLVLLSKVPEFERHARAVLRHSSPAEFVLDILEHVNSDFSKFSSSFPWYRQMFRGLAHAVSQSPRPRSSVAKRFNNLLLKGKTTAFVLLNNKGPFRYDFAQEPQSYADLVQRMILSKSWHDFAFAIKTFGTPKDMEFETVLTYLGTKDTLGPLMQVLEGKEEKRIAWDILYRRLENAWLSLPFGLERASPCFQEIDAIRDCNSILNKLAKGLEIDRSQFPLLEASAELMYTGHLCGEVRDFLETRGADINVLGETELMLDAIEGAIKRVNGKKYQETVGKNVILKLFRFYETTPIAHALAERTGLESYCRKIAPRARQVNLKRKAVPQDSQFTAKYALDCPVYFVDTPDKLARAQMLLDSMKSAIVGVDTEGSPNPYLFQVGIQTETPVWFDISEPNHRSNRAAFLLDLTVLPIKETTRLVSLLFQNPKFTTIGFSFSSDLNIIRSVLPGFPADDDLTYIEASKKGGGGLAKTVLEKLQVVLDKVPQKSDWSRRPLRPRQIEYAASDVMCLVDVYMKQNS